MASQIQLSWIPMSKGLYVFDNCCESVKADTTLADEYDLWFGKVFINSFSTLRNVHKLEPTLTSTWRLLITTPQLYSSTSQSVLAALTKFTVTSWPQFFPFVTKHNETCSDHMLIYNFHFYIKYTTFSLYPITFLGNFVRIHDWGDLWHFFFFLPWFDWTVQRDREAGTDTVGNGMWKESSQAEVQPAISPWGVCQHGTCSLTNRPPSTPGDLWLLTFDH